MIKIAICDDEPKELKRSSLLLKQYIGEHPHLDIMDFSFSAPLDLLSHVEQKNKFDVLLLDVYMPGLLGIEVAQELRDLGDTCQIIFLTTSRDHAVDAFSLNAAHYLVKPYSKDTLFSAIDKAIGNLTKKNGQFITFKSTEGICRVDLEKIVYSESDSHTQRIVLSDGKVVTIRKTSTELFELLVGNQNFYKCGSTYIFNMDFVSELSSKGVVFSTGKKLPILSRKYAEFKKTYMDYCCNN